MIQENPELWKV